MKVLLALISPFIYIIQIVCRMVGQGRSGSGLNGFQEPISSDEEEGSFLLGCPDEPPPPGIFSQIIFNFQDYFQMMK